MKGSGVTSSYLTIGASAVLASSAVHCGVAAYRPGGSVASIAAASGSANADRSPRADRGATVGADSPGDQATTSAARFRSQSPRPGREGGARDRFSEVHQGCQGRAGSPRRSAAKTGARSLPDWMPPLDGLRFKDACNDTVYARIDFSQIGVGPEQPIQPQAIADFANGSRILGENGRGGWIAADKGELVVPRRFEGPERDYAAGLPPIPRTDLAG